MGMTAGACTRGQRHGSTRWADGRKAVGIVVGYMCVNTACIPT